MRSFPSGCRNGGQPGLRRLLTHRRTSEPPMSALPPGSMIGILGGGQLGRMLAMAAARLGLRCHIFSDHRGPAFDVAAGTTLGDFTDVEAIRRFAGSVDVVTYDFENVPVDAATAA